MRYLGTLWVICAWIFILTVVVLMLTDKSRKPQQHPDETQQWDNFCAKIEEFRNDFR